eukprot:GSMAST32.ASY1.ANO1.1017.1 assembled CDS
MCMNFATLYGALFTMSLFLINPSKLTSSKSKSTSRWLPPCSSFGNAKRATEIWFLGYGCIWITVFACIIGGGMYNWFDSEHYLIVCIGLAAPLLLQPFIFPALTSEADVPLIERYSFKANVWIAIFNLNGVPIPMFFATHFYFSFYHTLSNLILRKIDTTYEAGICRFLFSIVLIMVMSYTTAFMETLTIAGFPCTFFLKTFIKHVLLVLHFMVFIFLLVFQCFEELMKFMYVFFLYFK